VKAQLGLAIEISTSLTDTNRSHYAVDLPTLLLKTEGTEYLPRAHRRPDLLRDRTKVVGTRATTEYPKLGPWKAVYLRNTGGKCLELPPVGISCRQ
jgi:hypothetical protein